MTSEPSSIAESSAPSRHTTGPTGTFSARVRYAETDQMGVAHHAAYFIWFESARTELCRAIGLDYGAMERDGLALPVVDAQCRYRTPARYDELVMVTARVARRSSRTLDFVYSVWKDDDLIAEGTTRQVLVRSDGRPTAFPTAIAALFDVAYTGAGSAAEAKHERG